MAGGKVSWRPECGSLVGGCVVYVWRTYVARWLVLHVGLDGVLWWGLLYCDWVCDDELFGEGRLSVGYLGRVMWFLLPISHNRACLCWSQMGMVNSQRWDSSNICSISTTISGIPPKKPPKTRRGWLTSQTRDGCELPLYHWRTMGIRYSMAAVALAMDVTNEAQVHRTGFPVWAGYVVPQLASLPLPSYTARGFDSRWQQPVVSLFPPYI